MTQLPPPVVNISVIGVLLAAIFAISMGTLLYWMLKIPRPITLEVARARRSVGALKRILVPTAGMPYSERGVELACRLGVEQTAEITLVYVIEVPRTLPLGAPLPDAEEKAQGAINRARAIVELHKLPVSETIERAREAGDGILKAAQERDADVIVMGIRPQLSIAKDVLGRTSDYLLRKAPCEVVLDKPCIPENNIK
jgi:nucleotide-binding universal stress UspA family protein